MLPRHRNIVVVICCGEKRQSRRACKGGYRHHNRVHRFEDFSAPHTHVDTQIVAAGRFDPPNLGSVVLWTGYFQHRRRVALCRRAHGRTSIAAFEAQVCHSSNLSQSCAAVNGAFVALSRNETHSSSESSTVNLVQSFSRSSVSTVRGPAGWSGQRLISRSLNSPARISDTHRASTFLTSSGVRHER